MPKAPARRSQVLQWLMWQMASVGPMFGQALHFRYIAPEGNDCASSRYRTEVLRLYDVLERQLSQQQWIAGDACSVADVAVYPWVGKYVKTLDIDMSSRPQVARWIAAFAARLQEVLSLICPFPASSQPASLGKDTPHARHVGHAALSWTPQNEGRWPRLATSAARGVVRLGRGGAQGMHRRREGVSAWGAYSANPRPRPPEAARAPGVVAAGSTTAQESRPVRRSCSTGT